MFHSDIELDITFPEIKWQGLRDIYGWAALQWQAWARGEILVQSDEILILQTPSILEFWVDGVQYWGGDYFGFERTPVVLRLEPGAHRIDVRLVREVRAMGGVGEPHVTTKLSLKKSFGNLQAVLHPGSGLLMSDFIGDGKNAILASPYASLTVRNDAEMDIRIFAVESTPIACVTELTKEITLIPGQTRPVVFQIISTHNPQNWRMDLKIRYRVVGEDYDRELPMIQDHKIRRWGEPHKVTFMHPGGVVSYAMLRSPSKSAAVVRGNTKLPILLALHGAGVEAELDEARNEFEPLPDLAAWVLFATGGTAWSGDDWHAWGFADVEAAVAMIPDWIKQVGWQGPDVSVNDWLVSGHSNGGQGTWYALAHRPDKVIAASPLSGYSSIQNYVSYTLWRTVDPSRTAIVHSALSSYRHEALLPNAKGIPVLQQHGGADDNVPVYHARLMSQLILEAGANSTYVEIPGKPHYWNGVYTTEPLRDFYQKHLAEFDETGDAWALREFSIVTANPGDTGSKQGVKILQLTTPGQLGRIDILFNPSTLECVLRTFNIKQFDLPWYFENCDTLSIDLQPLPISLLKTSSSKTLVHEGGEWRTAEDTILQIPPFTQRQGLQLGAMDAILHTEGTFLIVEHSPTARPMTLQISRNLNQYFAADASITTAYETALDSPGNIISVAIGANLPSGLLKTHPIQILGRQITIRSNSSRGNISYHATAEQGLAAIFLRPQPLGRLELVVWGVDEESLTVAARLVPMMTGTGQPDFIIVDRSMLWKGLEGAVALGFLDNDWEISDNAFFA
jgi:predicted esterase